jgi:hypothetical protein
MLSFSLSYFLPLTTFTDFFGAPYPPSVPAFLFRFTPQKELHSGRGANSR